MESFSESACISIGEQVSLYLAPAGRHTQPDAYPLTSNRAPSDPPHPHPPSPHTCCQAVQQKSCQYASQALISYMLARSSGGQAPSATSVAPS